MLKALDLALEIYTARPIWDKQVENILILFKQRYEMCTLNKQISNDENINSRLNTLYLQIQEFLESQNLYSYVQDVFILNQIPSSPIHFTENKQGTVASFNERDLISSETRQLKGIQNLRSAISQAHEAIDDINNVKLQDHQSYQQNRNSQLNGLQKQSMSVITEKNIQKSVNSENVNQPSQTIKHNPLQHSNADDYSEISTKQDETVQQNDDKTTTANDQENNQITANDQQSQNEKSQDIPDQQSEKEQEDEEVPKPSQQNQPIEKSFNDSEQNKIQEGNDENVLNNEQDSKQVLDQENDRKSIKSQNDMAEDKVTNNQYDNQYQLSDQNSINSNEDITSEGKNKKLEQMQEKLNMLQQGEKFDRIKYLETIQAMLLESESSDSDSELSGSN